MRNLILTVFAICLLPLMASAATETEFKCVSAADITDTTSTTVTGCAAITLKKYFIDVWSCENSSAVDSKVELYSNTTLIDIAPLPQKGGFIKPLPNYMSGNAVNEALKVKVLDGSTATRCSIHGYSSELDRISSR